jgi:hypothetical protein
LQVLNLIEEQLKKVEQSIDALLVVGGFSGSDYLFSRIQVCKLEKPLISLRRYSSIPFPVLTNVTLT